ncbi:hypothetical protein BC828DRAFT_385999 [Blastocladiella britannica]|nr:hypothetical protein BC828DRAFT_385999 [Blastocladiella britannica]
MTTRPRMLVLALVVVVLLAAVPRPGTATRIAGHRPPSHRAGTYGANFTSGQLITAMSTEDGTSRKATDGSTGGAFQITFTCKASDGNFCSKAHAAFDRAAARIASELKFRRTITVDLSMFLPCGTTSPDDSCDELTTLGFAMPTQRYMVTHKDDNLTYLYPTSLLKQLDFPEIDQGRVQFPKYDILARFNSLRNWWFTTDGTDMTDQQRDLEQVATHELLHGLGYGDDTLMSYRVGTNQMLAPYFDSSAPSVQPPPEATDSSASVFNGNGFYRFTLPSIWNRFTFLSNKPMTALTASLTAAIDAGVKSGAIKPSTLLAGNSAATDPVYSPAAVFSYLMADPPSRATMTQLYSLGTTNATLQFRPNAFNPPSPQLATAVHNLETNLNPVLDGSSFAHVTQAANTTAEFLMVYKATGKSFPVMVSSTKGLQSGIGQSTKDVLVALGYTAAGTPLRSVANVATMRPEGLLAKGTTTPPANTGSGASGGMSAAARSVVVLAVAMATAVLLAL